MNKEGILKEISRQFNQITGGKIKQLPCAEKDADAILQITAGKEKHNFLVQVKNELRQINMASILEKIGKQKDRWLLASQYIPQPIKDRLKEQGINYLEVAGNCYIDIDGLFLYINDRPVTPFRQTPTGKLWKPAGLRFIFVIISDPILLNKPYRTIAYTANIALGNIGPLLEELEHAGYIEKNKNGWILINHSFLIERWIELFQAILKPKLQKGRFRFLDKSMQQRWKSIVPDDFLWGGEPAGELFTHFLEPESFTIYSNKSATELMKELKLIPDSKGEVELVSQFWNSMSLLDSPAIPYVVPPLLAYADLMESNDSRNWEVAERIKNKYLYE